MRRRALVALAEQPRRGSRTVGGEAGAPAAWRPRRWARGAGCSPEGSCSGSRVARAAEKRGDGEVGDVCVRTRRREDAYDLVGAEKNKGPTTLVEESRESVPRESSPPTSCVVLGGGARRRSFVRDVVRRGVERRRPGRRCVPRRGGGCLRRRRRRRTSSWRATSL